MAAQLTHVIEVDFDGEFIAQDLETANRQEAEAGYFKIFHTVVTKPSALFTTSITLKKVTGNVEEVLLTSTPKTRAATDQEARFTLIRETAEAYFG